MKSQLVSCHETQRHLQECISKTLKLPSKPTGETKTLNLAGLSRSETSPLMVAACGWA